jgi:hypothetical protein
MKVDGMEMCGEGERSGRGSFICKSETMRLLDTGRSKDIMSDTEPANTLSFTRKDSICAIQSQIEGLHALSKYRKIIKFTF